MAPKVVAVNISPDYTMSKPVADSITLVAGLGVDRETSKPSRQRSDTAESATSSFVSFRTVR